MTSLEKIKDLVSIVEEIGSIVKLKKNGILWWGLCPFHVEKTPSFSVNEEKKIYHCFGCGNHGDILTFFQTYENKNFSEILEKFCDKFSIKIDKKIADQIPIYKEILQICQEDYKKNLENNEEKLQYLIKERGLQKETIDFFQLGFSDGNVIKKLLDKTFNEDTLRNAGIIGIKASDRMRGRITFPLFNRKKELIGFAGRGEDPKYLHFAETVLFQKSLFMFNENNLQYDKPITIVEGYFDAISMHAAGLENVVAIMGTNIGLTHLLTIFKMTKKLYVMLDGDSSGQRAISTNLDHFLKILTPEREIFICNVNEKDPDELLKKEGIQAMNKVYENSQDLFQWIVDNKLEKDSTINGLAKKLENIESILEVIKNQNVKKAWKIYFNKVIYKDKFFAKERGVGKKEPKFLEKSQKNVVKIPTQKWKEEKIIFFILKFPEILEEVYEPLMNIKFSDDFLDKIRVFLIDQMTIYKETPEKAIEKSMKNYPINLEMIQKTNNLCFIMQNVGFILRYTKDLINFFIKSQSQK